LKKKKKGIKPPNLKTVHKFRKQTLAMKHVIEESDSEVEDEYCSDDEDSQ
jgi:hypothetical protein